MTEHEAEPVTPVVGVLPGQGWSIKRKLESGWEVVQPVIGFAVHADGIGNPIIADENGVIYVLDGGPKREWLIPPAPTSPPGGGPLGDVSLSEAGNVAFAFLLLRGQAERAAQAIRVGETELAEGLLKAMAGTVDSTERYLPASRRMAKWIALAMESEV